MAQYSSDVIIDNVVPVTGPLTDAELRATPIDVNATFAPSGIQDVNLVSTIPVPVTDNAGSLTVDGTVSISGSVAVTGPLTDAQLRASAVPTKEELSSVATITSVILTNNTNATLLAANASRRQAIIFCPSSTLQIKYGATASITSFTWKVSTNNTTIVVSGYSGRIDAFGTGQTVTITEF